jgi:hypothetical protein
MARGDIHVDLPEASDTAKEAVRPVVRERSPSA